jgi:hypothetical protein
MVTKSFGLWFFDSRMKGSVLPAIQGACPFELGPFHAQEDGPF